MNSIEIYLLLFLIIYILNVIPAFMPPTWVILSFLYIQNHLLFIPTVILGVIAATCGRITLALMARHGLMRFLPSKFISNYHDLGGYLQQNKKITIPVVLGYAFSPISSNSLFIMAGMANLNLPIIAISFFIGRLISYSFWISASHQLSHKLEDIFIGNFTNIGTLISATVSLAVILIIGKIKWSKIFN